MNAEELAAIRERAAGRYVYPFYLLDAVDDADALLAHIDALTAKVEGLPMGDAVWSVKDRAYGWHVCRAEVLAILRGES